MAQTELTDFVKAALASGQDRQSILAVLESAGWRETEIATALSQFAESDFPVPVPRPRPYLSAREAFLYLFFFILLGIVAFNLGSLLFALIERALPDKNAANDWQYVRSLRQIRFAISGLIVGLPIFLFLARTLVRSRQANPEMQRSRIRKWITYISLIIAGCTLVGDAISLLYNLLQGELSLRFLLKALVVAGIAGAIFAYFIGDAEKGDTDGDVKA